MRIIHTSDWHLGRQLHGVSLEEDHDAVLAQVEAAIEEHAPDILIIAGDIFDRATPPQSALRRFGDFVRRVDAEGGPAIVLIAGNHDSAAQIGMMGALAAPGRSLVRGPLVPEELPMLVSDEHGLVAISALPFSFEFAARSCFGNDEIICPADVLSEQVSNARRHVPEGARWVIVAHAFVEGASTSDGERPLTRAVGGIETVPSSVFDGAHYVALGHLHRPQQVGNSHIRYSGAPLAFGFDEEGHEKSMTLVDLAADGAVTTLDIPFVPLRRLRSLCGKLAELLAAPHGSDDFISIVLTDDTPQIDPMRRIRKLYPNAVQLSYRRGAAVEERGVREGGAALDQPRQVIDRFLSVVRDKPISEDEGALVDAALGSLDAAGENA